MKKEKIGLAEITVKSTQSENLFYNDADDHAVARKGIDPRAMLFDHSADPLSYATMQIKMSDSVIKKYKKNS
ncbi:MAG: zinc-dependent metalloprotease [Bacteroidetes bacterium]|nr:zinc-dependent metalloprotease [Bacteroidota bacterium]